MSLGADAQPEQPKYHISNVVPLGPPDRWDYVVFDPESHRIYVAHGDRVTVVDGLGGGVIGTVEGMPGGTHGVPSLMPRAKAIRMMEKPASRSSSTCKP
jgi:hypothetical protein